MNDWPKWKLNKSLSLSIKSSFAHGLIFLFIPISVPNYDVNDSLQL